MNSKQCLATQVLAAITFFTTITILPILSVLPVLTILTIVTIDTIIIFLGKDHEDLCAIYLKTIGDKNDNLPNLAFSPPTSLSVCWLEGFQPVKEDLTRPFQSLLSTVLGHCHHQPPHHKACRAVYHFSKDCQRDTSCIIWENRQRNCNPVPLSRWGNHAEVSHSRFLVCSLPPLRFLSDCFYSI